MSVVIGGLLTTPVVTEAGPLYGSSSVRRGESVAFDRWFTALPLGYWARFTTVDEVRLELTASAEALVRESVRTHDRTQNETTSTTIATPTKSAAPNQSPADTRAKAASLRTIATAHQFCRRPGARSSTRLAAYSEAYP